ncbi:MAG TPA: glycoside hydrolase family 28 protein [Chitinophagaceae bacterium]|nr:glycoside hydrolase family 28 protein [Chitinophagaceae bacterium]
MKKITLLGCCILLVGGLFFTSCNNNSKQEKPITGWDKLAGIRNNIQPPTFPDKDFFIMDFGAVQDSTKDCLPAIKKAITACNEAGGGRVIIPEGTWFVKGPIHLKSNVNLHLEKGSVLKFSTHPDDYLPVVLTRYEGLELMNYSPLIYAYEKENIAITGKGVLDGQASNEHWWWWCGTKRFGWKEGQPSQRDSANRPELARLAAQGVPAKERIFGKGHYLRPTFVEPYKCKNVLIKGVTIKNPPFWILHPTLSKNVTIDGVTTISYGPNNDGCDPESCDGVLIKNCFFNTGDDCIAIKSGRDEDGRRIGVPTKNIIIEDCHMEDGHGGVVVGSESSGGVENLYVQNCKMNSPHLDRAIRIKSNARRGGTLKNFYFRNIEVGQVHEAVIKINMFYFNEKGDYIPTLDSVFIDHVVSQKSEYAINIQGIKGKPVKNIFIDSCEFNHVEKENVITEAENVQITHSTINGNPIVYNDQK